MSDKVEEALKTKHRGPFDLVFDLKTLQAEVISLRAQLAMAFRVVESHKEREVNAVRIGCENITRAEKAEASNAAKDGVIEAQVQKLGEMHNTIVKGEEQLKEARDQVAYHQGWQTKLWEQTQEWRNKLVGANAKIVATEKKASEFGKKVAELAADLDAANKTVKSTQDGNSKYNEGNMRHISDLRAENASLLKQVEEITADRDEWRQQHENLLSVRKTDIDNVLKAASEREAEYRKALEVAATQVLHREDCPNECNCWKKVFVDVLTKFPAPADPEKKCEGCNGLKKDWIIISENEGYWVPCSTCGIKPAAEPGV